jgi:hypothetical protein
MASEDSRYRERWRRFICSVSDAIRSKPDSVRCTPSPIRERTVENLSKSSCLAVRSGWRRKNGITAPNDRDREAAFAIDEADDPLLDTWPFLLIARTGRIVTAHVVDPSIRV